MISNIIGTLLTSFSVGLSTLKATLTASSAGLAVDQPLFVDGIGATAVEITSASSPYTPTDVYTILVDTSGGNVVITLPAVAARANRLYRFMKTTTDANTVTLTPDGAELISGLASYVFSTANKGVEIVAGPSAWFFTAAVSRASYLTVYDDTFGDGSDGDVTIAGSTTSATNMNYSNLVVTGTLTPARKGIWVRNRMSGNGVVEAGGDGATGAVAGSAKALSYLGGSAGGGNGGSVAGQVGSTGGSMTRSISAATGAGGAGGASGGANAGGAGGAAAAPAATEGGQGSPYLYYAGSFRDASTFQGGNGGGGGGSQVNSIGGGGGGGGSSILFRVRILDFTGTFNAPGGSGANAQLSTGAGSGGGGGGGGGWSILVTDELRQTPTVNVAGGTPGALAGTGSAGIAGSDGFKITVRRVAAP